jgi:Ca2+-transporting ATPase
MNKATNIYINGKVRRLSVGDKYEIKQTIKGLSSEGNRCLALTYKEFDQVSSQNVELTSKDEDNLTFLGLITLVDPPRLEARLAITESLLAGIKPIMITGDHELTAVAIAKEVGIFKDGDLSLIGNDLDKVSDNALLKNIEQISVYARVSPVHKIRIVKAWQSHGAVVAFVGDGVNDGPAIREANIGISMGKSGTEVSKEASSIILTDDNYYTIIKAVRNGRKIYINIQNAITFLISGNAAAIFLVVYTSLLNLTLPFAPVHLLFINLLTDSLPAIAIGMEDSHDDLLKKPPRKTTDSLLSKRILQIIVFEGILIAIFTLLSYYLGLKSSPYVARTMVFGTLCMARLFHSFNCRGSKSIFKNKVKNKAMIISFIVGMVLINLVLFSPPLQPIFHSYELNNLQTIMIFVNAIMPTVILQLILIFRYRRRRY